MLRNAAIVLLLFSLGAHATPVLVGGDGNLDACGGYGKTKQLTRLHQSPAAKAAGIADLPVGTELFICSETADGKWFGVVLQNATSTCGVSSPQKKKAAYKGKCKSGWVPATAVEYLAG